MENKNVNEISLENLKAVTGAGAAEFEQYLAEMCKKYNVTRDKVLKCMSAAEIEQANLLKSL